MNLNIIVLAFFILNVIFNVCITYVIIKLHYHIKKLRDYIVTNNETVNEKLINHNIL